MMAKPMALAFVVAAAAASPLQAATLIDGVYALSFYVVSAKAGTATGATCPDGTGTQGLHLVTYPGAAAMGYKIRSPLFPHTPGTGMSSSSFVPLELDTGFPATPSAGATSWSGRYKFAYYPAGDTGTVDFTANFKTLSSTVEKGRLKLHFHSASSTNNGCVEDFNYLKIFTGRG